MSDAVQQIKDRLSIIDVVAPYVELHKSGRNLKGKSPFTTEKTPSFYVSPERGMYYCFSTSQGGDIFTFIQTMEGVDFKGALKILAEKAKVELVPVSPEKQNERDRLYSVLEEATHFYQTRLKLDKASTDYLKKRGVSEESVASWRIGFAPGPPEAGWRTTKMHLTEKGFSNTELAKAGLIKGSEDGKEPYDVFRNRVMFPLFDQGGRVVAFSGRTLETGTDIPKYVNSPETELYKKSELLFGYDRAKHGIRHLDFSLIVEGQFDVVMSHQAGYINTVAVSGTALTLEHVKLLERLSKKVVLALDADRAGIAAAKRVADIMLRRGLDVKVALLPEGNDPADLILKDPKEFKRIIGKSVHVIEFLLETLKRSDLDPRTFKLRAREEVVPYVPLLPNKIDQDHFESIIAEALKTTKDAVHFEVERCIELAQNSEKLHSVPEERQSVRNSSNDQKTEPRNRQESLVVFLLGAVAVLPELIGKEVIKKVREFTKLSEEDLEKSVSVSDKAEVVFKAEKFIAEQPKHMFEAEVVHALNQLYQLVIKNDLAKAKEEQRKSELEGDTERSETLLKQVVELQKKRQVEPVSVEQIFGKEAK